MRRSTLQLLERLRQARSSLRDQAAGALHNAESLLAVSQKRLAAARQAQKNLENGFAAESLAARTVLPIERAQWSIESAQSGVEEAQRDVDTGQSHSQECRDELLRRERGVRTVDASIERAVDEKRAADKVRETRTIEDIVASRWAARR